MEVYTGIDIIEVVRIKNNIETNQEKFLNRIYTSKEIEYCESKRKARYQHYAARFAAKEAIFKAISKLLNSKYELTWKNAEVLNDENGKPYINFLNTDIEGKIEDIDISISHCKEYAIASVVLILKNK